MEQKQNIILASEEVGDAESEEEELDLHEKKPRQVKSEVESLVKELSSHLREHPLNLEQESVATASNTLLKYAHFTWENTEEKMSSKIYAGFLCGGLPSIAKTLWEVKAKEKIDLDDKLKHPHFAKVFLNIVRIIELLSYESVAVCRALLAHGLLTFINADLESELFMKRLGQKTRESTVAACTNSYFGIIYYFYENDDNLDHKVSKFVTEKLQISTTKKYKKAKSASTQIKVAKVMSLQNLNEVEFQDLIEMPMDLARSIVKQLRESASSGTAKGSKGLSFWDIITYVDMLLSYKGSSCKYLIVAGFLTFARDVLHCTFRSAEKEVQSGKNEEDEEDEEDEEEFELDESDLKCLLKCVRSMAYFKAGAYRIMSKQDLFPSGELQTALQKTKEAEKKVTEENEDSDEEIAEDESIEMIAAQCVSIVHLRLQQNPNLTKALHLGCEQLIRRRHVMVSYSWALAKDTVVKIADTLKAAGLAVWRDEERLKPGTNLQRAMLEAVEGAVLVLVFYSPPYYRSRNCQFEYQQLEQMKRPVLPVLVDAIDDQNKQEYKDYENWLNKQLKEKSAERIYFKTSDANKDDFLQHLVDGVKAIYDEEMVKMQTNFEDMAPEEWNRLQVDAWLEKNKLDDLKKLNLDGKTLQDFAERATIRSAKGVKDELCAELITKYKVTPKLLLRFVAALEQL